MAPVVEHDRRSPALAAVFFDEPGQARSYLVGGSGAPVRGHGIPHHGRQSQFAGNAQGGWTARSEGRAEVANGRAEDRFEFSTGAG